MNPDLSGAHLTEAARAAWAGFNDTTAAVPDVTVADLFARSVAEFPDRPAVADETDELSYAQLDAHASAIAARLRAAGVRAGDRVGILDGRCVATYAAVVAALKVGAVFVPVDPLLPTQRLAVIAADCGLSAMVVSGKDRPADLPGPVVDADPVEPTGPATTGFAERGRTDLAYTIYTSGSTGTPKGVRIRHDSLTNLVQWVLDACPVRPTDVLAQMSPLYFDPAMQQIFPAWAAGACLVPVPLDLLLEPFELADWLRRRRVSHLDLVTPHWASMLAAYEAAGRPVDLPDMRWLLVGGESMHYEQYQRWRAVVGGPSRLINVYGPTEAAVNASTLLVEDTPTSGKVPIGLPLPNYDIFVLDAGGRLCPPYAVGEIVIGGVGVADGYTDPARTREFFPADPRDPGRLLYRTGDLGRLVVGPGGAPVLEFGGRVDSQVKVAGYRIELEEIETVLGRCPLISDAAVVVVERGDVRSLLCLYVSAEDAEEALREYLADALPTYMIPARFRRVERLEYKVTGKFDRDEMIARYAGAAADDRPGRVVEPVGELATTVHTVWLRAVGADAIEEDDEFFHTGGSSLSALEMVARLTAATGVRLRVMDLYRRPTFAAFVAMLEERVNGVTGDAPAAAADVEPIAVTRRVVTGPELPSLLTQRPSGPPTGDRLPLLGVARGTPVEHDTVVRIVLDVGGDSDGVVSAALGDVIAAHPALRTVVVPGAEPALAPVPVASLILPVTDADLDADAVEGIVADLPWDAATELPVMAVLLRGADGTGTLVLCVSHVVADGEAQSTIATDLTTALESRRRGAAPRLSASGTRYRDYVRFLADAASRPEVAEERARAAAFDDVAAAMAGALPNRLVRGEPQLRAEPVRPEASVLATVGSVLAAFADMLGLPVLPVHMDFHGRVHETAISTVGNFAVTMPLLVDARDGESPAARSERTLGQLAARYPAYLRVVAEAPERPESLIRISVFEESEADARGPRLADGGHGDLIDVSVTSSGGRRTLAMSGAWDLTPVWARILRSDVIQGTPCDH
ncbi:MAG: amino acid adenylation domain-containing protein [Actinocatenispora sp.]